MKTIMKILKYTLASLLILAIFTSSPGYHTIVLKVPTLYGVKQQLFTWFGNTDNLDVFPSVEAATQNIFNGWTHWPSSQYYKAPGNGWIMPFEIFHADPVIIGQNAPYPHHGDLSYHPNMIDINGDGLFDVLYSRYTEPWHAAYKSSISSWFPRGVRTYIGEGQSLEQYMLFNTGNTFRAVFKCKQVMARDNSGNWSYRYYGDCADTLRPDDPQYTALPFSTGSYFVEHNIPASTVGGLDININDKHPIRCKRFHSTSGETRMAYFNCMRSQPRFLDVNGDGLLDVIFKGGYKQYFHVSSYTRGNEGYHKHRSEGANASYVLLNTGSSFVPQP
jgi:hypothetical protein